MSAQSKGHGWFYVPVLLRFQRWPAIAGVPAMRWIVPTDNLILALPAITSVSESPVPQNKRQSSPTAVLSFWYTTIFSSRVNPRYESGCYETASFEMGPVPRLRGVIWQGLRSPRNTEHLAVLYIYSGIYPAQLSRHLNLMCLMKSSFLTGFFNSLCSHWGDENAFGDIQKIELSPNTVSERQAGY